MRRDDEGWGTARGRAGEAGVSSGGEVWERRRRRRRRIGGVVVGARIGSGLVVCGDSSR